jgi:crotonobetainyl-CoA:carnitine CoA-transferase CaiB-like acyl-CoA transferase
VRHRDELDERLTAWIAARPSADVLAAFDAAQAAISPVYDVAQLCADPHVVAGQVFVEPVGVRMPGPVGGLTRTPGAVRQPGRPLGADTDAVRRDGWG